MFQHDFGDFVGGRAVRDKDTGVWKDFGGDNEAKPFTALVEKL